MRKLLVLLVGIFFFIQNSIGQCYPDRHNTSLGDAWISCTKSVNPNSSVRPVSHWIQFDFGSTTYLSTSNFWNVNHPDKLNAGVKTLAIDYSSDGQNWQEFGKFNFEKASGKSIFEGIEGPDFDNLQTKYLLFTILENFGDMECAGFSEIRIDLGSPTTATVETLQVGKLKVFPNPFQNEVQVVLPGNSGESLFYQIRDVYGRIVKTSHLHPIKEFNISSQNLTPGNYFLSVYRGSETYHTKLIYIER